MSAMMEHDDFRKSRRALIVSSAFLFIVSSLEFRSDEIDVLGLKFGIDQEKVVSLCSATVLYFLYIYIVLEYMK